MNRTALQYLLLIILTMTLAACSDSDGKRKHKKVEPDAQVEDDVGHDVEEVDASGDTEGDVDGLTCTESKPSCVADCRTDVWMDIAICTSDGWRCPEGHFDPTTCSDEDICGGAAPTCVETCAGGGSVNAVCGMGIWECPGSSINSEDCDEPACGPGSIVSDLPGVRLEFTDQRCEWTLAEAAAGIAIRHRVVIEAVVLDVDSRPLDGGGCQHRGASGLAVFERLEGDGELYCICDEGLCLQDFTPIDLHPGSHSSDFVWDGRNWMGPSDTGLPKGEPFSPGTYTLSIRAAGWVGEDPFELRSEFHIRLEE